MKSGKTSVDRSGLGGMQLTKGWVFAWQLMLVAVLCGIWELIGRISPQMLFVLGSPSTVCAEFWALLVDDHLAWHFWVTGSEAFIGLAIGTLGGSALGLALWFSEGVSRISRPFVVGLGTLPVFAFAPLMIVWFGVGFGMKVALSAFATVFVSFSQAHKGAQLVSRIFIDDLRGMGATPQQIFGKVVVPGSLDWVLSSMRLNVGFGLLGAFIGEFIAAQEGLGYLILRAGGLYNIPRAIAAAIGITMLALLMEAFARFVEEQRRTLIQVLSVPSCVWEGRFLRWWCQRSRVLNKV